MDNTTFITKEKPTTTKITVTAKGFKEEIFVTGNTTPESITEKINEALGTVTDTPTRRTRKARNLAEDAMEAAGIRG